MKAITLLLCLTLLAGCGASSEPRLPTQAGVDLQRYAGTWYEQARLPNRFQADCTGTVRADYTLQPAGSIAVLNQCDTGAGERKSASAEGRIASGAQPPDPARLEVRFAPAWTSWLPFVWGDYWILRLDDDYRYSLVGTPDRQYLWVLSREEHADRQAVDRLLEHARSLGFATETVIRPPS